MKIPYYFDLEVYREKVFQRLPDWSSYSLSFAKCSLYSLGNDIQILSQKLNSSPFLVDMLEIKVNKAGSIPFKVTGNHTFLYFMLSGQVTFTQDDGSPIIVTGNNTFMISISDTGSFAFNADSGKYAALVITIKKEWLQERANFFPNTFSAFIANSNKSFYSMSQYKIDKKVAKWVERIYNYSSDTMEGLDGHLRKYISYILKSYEFRLEQEGISLAERVKEYLEVNYCNPELTVDMIADHFCVTRYTLRNHFKRKYSLTPQVFYTRLRLDHAIEMMKSEDVKAIDIFDKVGYKDIRSFRLALQYYLRRK